MRLGICFCGSFLLFMFRLCHVFLSVYYSLVVTCWEKADLLALLYVMFYCVFVTFPCDVMGQVWCLMYRFQIVAFFLTLNEHTKKSCIRETVNKHFDF